MYVQACTIYVQCLYNGCKIYKRLHVSRSRQGEVRIICTNELVATRINNFIDLLWEKTTQIRIG